MLDTKSYKNTHSQCVIIIAFPLNNGYTNASQRYVIRTLPALLIIMRLFIRVSALLLVDFVTFVQFTGHISA